jgi:Kef-type K+ transport system membrane component KefB/mannitol/fructose-specific phosphotransferase system IIA component (Ntr-type)
MTELVLQIGVILFAVRVCGRLVKRIGIPSVLGELLAGVIIGPYALGSIAFPGFDHGLFPLVEAGVLAVSPELYGFATVASIILLFASGLETNIALFLRYSLVSGLIGIGGVVVSFIFGDIVGMALLHTGFMDPRCLFFGVLSTATSVGITARILSDQKKMDSPEGVTILAAAVFDDVLGIIILAVVLGIVALLTSNSGGSLDVGSILLIASKAFGIWLGFTALGLIFAKHIAGFLKMFKTSYDFSILALGVALVLAGVFEKQGLAMIIGAYIAGLSLSKTDIAALIQERIHGLYEFFVPLFFAVMGMMVNIRELASVQVLLFGAIYTLMAIAAKLIGCGVSAMALGFNAKGALRIGTGMVPRGEVALIIAGIGLSSGVLDSQLFGIIILMTFITTIIAPPLLNVFLKLPGAGTRKPAKGNDAATAVWDFFSDEIAGLVLDTLLKQLRTEGFYVQMMNINDGISQARKGDISLSITKEENTVTIATGKSDMSFVKTAMYEVILTLGDSIQKLKETANPAEMKKELAQMVEGRMPDDKLLARIESDCVSIDLKGNDKNAIITELVDLLASKGRLNNRDDVLRNVFERERSMSTGMEHGIALPHGKSDGVDELRVAVGIKKDGVDFGSLDGERSRLFILVVAPRKTSGPHVQFLAAISAVLRVETTRQELFKATTAEEVVELLRGK